MWRALQAGGFIPIELKDAGFTLMEFRAEGFELADLREADFSDEEIKLAGCYLRELKAHVLAGPTLLIGTGNTHL